MTPTKQKTSGGLKSVFISPFSGNSSTFTFKLKMPITLLIGLQEISVATTDYSAEYNLVTMVVAARVSNGGMKIITDKWRWQYWLVVVVK